MKMEGVIIALTALSLCLVMLASTLHGVQGEGLDLFGRRMHQGSAFIPFTSSTRTIKSRHYRNQQMKMTTSDKGRFLESLDTTESLNLASTERTNLLQHMIDKRVDVPSNQLKEENDDASSSRSLERPGLQETFNIVSEGNWKVIYAPHMTTIAGLFGGKFDVQYLMYENEKMTSHAKYDFPIIGRGYLSVSGTYSSVDENISRVDFDKAWVKPMLFSNENDDDKEEPYEALNDVPDGPIKALINSVGQTFFIEQFSVFPISFLDENMIVFDFPFLGTRICALKQNRD